jgi:hypothetical protein
VADDESDLTDATELLWDQAQRQLSQQSTDLDTVRTRAIAMLSVGALAAALFGSRLPHAHLAVGTTIAVAFALTFFAVSVVLAAQIVKPMKRAWRFTYPLRPLVGEVRSGSALPMDVALSLTHYAEESRMANEEKLENLHKQLGLVCLLTGLQVVAWAVAALAF